MHMIMNNLDPHVAQFPHELVTYGGNGQVFSNWAQVSGAATLPFREVRALWVNLFRVSRGGWGVRVFYVFFKLINIVFLLYPYESLPLFVNFNPK